MAGAGGLAVAGEQVLERSACAVRGADLDWEFMLNALRLTSGVPARTFAARTGRSLRPLDPILSSLRHRGLLCADTETLQATDLGYRFLDDVVQCFLPAPHAVAPA